MKDSGFDAIGRFPESWGVYRLKDVLRQAAKTHANLATQYVGLEHIVGWTGKATPIGLEIAGYQSAQPIPQGAICFSKLRPYLAKALFAQTDLIGTGELLVTRALRSVRPGYVLYWLLSHRFINGINDAVVGTKMPRVDWPIFAGMPVPLPKVDEQRRIAAWLDIQSHRIDKRRELLVKKRELLGDLRQTLLDEVISNGLAQSGIVQTGQPALPKLPIDWSLSKFKSKVFFREGPGIMATDFTDAGVPLLRIANMTPGVIAMAGCNYVTPEKAERQWRQFRLKLGDLVISASASTGIVTEAGTDAVGAIPYTGLIILRPKTGLTKAYLRLFVISKGFLGQVEDYLKGSTIHHFGPTHLRQMLIPVPPLAEQNAIAAFLDRKLSQIDRQIALIGQLDELLKQQRKAIIHEAVTGKIDLSAYEPPTQAA